MRADSHFVDEITATRPMAVGRMIEIDRLDANPDQPRQEHSGIEQLAESIREKGILEPILVRPLGEHRFQIIAGERRYRAALHVGLTKVPCIEIDVDERGCLEISLIENLQRRDLTHFEEADAIARLVEDFGYTHEQVARKLGRSRTSMTEILSLNRMPEAVKEACRRADISTKSTLMEIVRQPSEAAMLSLVEAVSREQLTRDDVRKLKRGDAAPRRQRDDGGAAQRPFVFRYRPPESEFTLSLRFDKVDVAPEELVGVLEGILRDLKTELADARRRHGEPPSFARPRRRDSRPGA